MKHTNQKHNKIHGTNLYLNVVKHVPQLILLIDPLHFRCRCFYQSQMNDDGNLTVILRDLFSKDLSSILKNANIHLHLVLIPEFPSVFSFRLHKCLPCKLGIHCHVNTYDIVFQSFSLTYGSCRCASQSCEVVVTNKGLLSGVKNS